jgi:hypothetical protein
MNGKPQLHVVKAAECPSDARIVRGLAVGWPEEQKEHVRSCDHCQERILEAWGGAGPHPVIERQYRREPEASLYGKAIRRFWKQDKSWGSIQLRLAAARALRESPTITLVVYRSGRQVALRYALE